MSALHAMQFGYLQKGRDKIGSSLPLGIWESCIKSHLFYRRLAWWLLRQHGNQVAHRRSAAWLFDLPLFCLTAYERVFMSSIGLYRIP